MARFFFHTQTDIRFTDVDGLELEGPVEARRQAIKTCGEMMRDAPEGFWGSRPWAEIQVDGSASAAGRS